MRLVRLLRGRKREHRCLAAGCLNEVGWPAIMCSYHWLGLPKPISDRVRREFCVRGWRDPEYKAAVIVAKRYWSVRDA